MAQDPVGVLIRGRLPRTVVGEEYGHAVSTVNAACAENSLPRFHVNAQRSCSGSALIDVLRAVFIVSAPQPVGAGPFLTDCLCREPS